MGALRGLIAGAAAGGLLLAGCAPRDSRSDAAAASTPPAATLEQPADKPAAPWTFAQKTADASVKLTLDRSLGRWPALHRQLYDLEVPGLKEFAASAKGQLDDLRKEGLPARPYANEITWAVHAATPRLVSVRQTFFEDTGGAHPNHGSGALLWDPAARRPVPPAALFTAADGAAVQAALCEGILAAKQAKGVDKDWDRGMWPCPDWRETDFLLAPSSVPGKFGGLVFLFGPYDIGPYAEGDYEVTLPWSVFTGVLAPAYAGEFAGTPSPHP
jgi:uncharacterized protein DUF3298